MLVKVQNNDVVKAMRKLKKKLFNEGVIQEVMNRTHYVKPSMAKKKKKHDAIRREQKRQRLRKEELGI